MATGDPAPRADWFWLRESGLLWVWSAAAEAPARRRFTARWDGAAPVPLAESPRRPGPGPMLDLIGVGAAADAWAATGPEGEARFVAGPSVQPVVYRIGGLVLRWKRGPWASIGVAAPTARGPRDYLFRWEQTIPAAGGEFPLPTEWLSREATELLVTPLDGAGRRGPTSRVVLPPQPPQVSVCFQQEMVGEGDRRRLRLRVEAAAVGAGAPADLEVHWAQGAREPRVFTLRVERPNMVYTLRLPEVGHKDRVTVRAAGVADGVEYRYAAGTPAPTAPGDGPSRRVELASGIDLREFTHVHWHSLPDPTAGAPPVPVSETKALRVLAADLLATPLGGSLPPPVRTAVETLPAAPLVHLARLGGNPELWRAVAQILGAGPGTDRVSDYLTRPHEYDLLFNDVLVREVVRVCPIPAAGLRSVRDLVLAPPARERADKSIFGRVGAILGVGSGRPDPHRDYLDRADDAVVNLWLAGVAAGDADRCTPDELYDLTAVRKWRCTALDLTLGVRSLRTFEREPIRVLRDHLIPSPSDPVCAAVDGAIEAEKEALTTPADLNRVREAQTRREAALPRVRDRLEQVQAPPGAAEDLARVRDLLAKGELRRAAFILEKLRGATELPPATPGMTFRVEARWADHARRAAGERDQRARQAAAWCRRLFADRMLPAWPVAPAADPDPTPDWERLREQLRDGGANGAAMSRYTPPTPADDFQARLAEVRAATPEGPAAAVLDELARHAAHLTWWLAAPVVARQAARDVGAAIDRLTTAAARDWATRFNRTVADAEAGRPELKALTAALEELARMVEEERVWLAATAAARAAGALPEVAGFTTDAVAGWLQRSGNDAPAGDAALAAREDGLLRSLAAARVPLPADPARPVLPAPGPTLLYPDEYAALRRRVEAGRGDRAGRVVRLEAALRQGWRLHPDWLDACLDRGEWDRITAAAATLTDLPGVQAEVQALLLDGYNHDPSLAALVAPRAAAGWVGGADDSGLVGRLQGVVGRAADTRGLLDQPGRVSELRADAAALRAQAGPQLQSLIGLRHYLADRLQHLLGQARERCPELPDPATPGGLAAALALIAGCEAATVLPTDPRAAALRAAGVLWGEGLA